MYFYISLGLFNSCILPNVLFNICSEYNTFSRLYLETISTLFYGSQNIASNFTVSTFWFNKKCPEA
jgi:hypothetical protein